MRFTAALFGTTLLGASSAIPSNGTGRINEVWTEEEEKAHGVE